MNSLNSLDDIEIISYDDKYEKETMNVSKYAKCCELSIFYAP